MKINKCQSTSEAALAYLYSVACSCGCFVFSSPTRTALQASETRVCSSEWGVSDSWPSLSCQENGCNLVGFQEPQEARYTESVEILLLRWLQKLILAKSPGHSLVRGLCALVFSMMFPGSSFPCQGCLSSSVVWDRRMTGICYRWLNGCPFVWSTVELHEHQRSRFSVLVLCCNEVSCQLLWQQRSADAWLLLKTQSRVSRLEVDLCFLILCSCHGYFVGCCCLTEIYLPTYLCPPN